MESILKKIEDKMIDWQLEGVEDHALQRFAARILLCLRKMDVLVAVDHVIFKKENAMFHVLERDLCNMDLEEIPMSRKEIFEKTRSLLLSLDPTLRGRLLSLDDGMAWEELNLSRGESQEPTRDSEMPELEDVSPLATETQNNDNDNTSDGKGKF